MEGLPSFAALKPIVPFEEGAAFGVPVWSKTVFVNKVEMLWMRITPVEYVLSAISPLHKTRKLILVSSS